MQKNQNHLYSEAKIELHTISIWTIGYSNRTLDEFLRLLGEHKIQVFVDVRSFPTSKIERFRKEKMEQVLPEYGI